MIRRGYAMAQVATDNLIQRILSLSPENIQKVDDFVSTLPYDVDYVEATDEEVEWAFKQLITQYGDVLEALAK